MVSRIFPSLRSAAALKSGRPVPSRRFGTARPTMTGGASSRPAARSSRTERLCSTNPFQRSRSRGGYPVRESSGVTIRSGRERAASSTPVAIRSALPRRSPTMVFIWRSAIFIYPDQYWWNGRHMPLHDPARRMGACDNTLQRHSRSDLFYGLEAKAPLEAMQRAHRRTAPSCPVQEAFASRVHNSEESA